MKTLLVLEDESAVMTLLRHMLKQYALIEAATAEQALGVLADPGRRIDLLIADVTLPTGSGIQVAQSLRAQIPNLPVILISGYPRSDWSARDFTDLERLGSNSVTILQKPFLSHTLLNAVLRLIGAPQASGAGNA
jgi:two-component system cell cycle sensor histidine kinase/response regulator CckA